MTLTTIFVTYVCYKGSQLICKKIDEYKQNKK